MTPVLICAMSRNRVIGRNNRLPWHLSEDLQHFKRTTMGGCLVMGRRTWESIGRALPGRTSIVLSSRPGYQAAGAQVVRSLDHALQLAAANAKEAGSQGLFVIGGSGLFEATLPLAQRMHLTRVHAEVQGDTWLRGFSEQEWRETARKDFAAAGDNPYDYSICLLERVSRVGAGSSG